MSEMVQRVTEAICAAERKWLDSDRSIMLQEATAIAAIKALREPTQDMFDRGIEAMQDMDGESKQATLKHLWPAMIDEALK